MIQKCLHDKTNINKMKRTHVMLEPSGDWKTEVLQELCGPYLNNMDIDGTSAVGVLFNFFNLSVLHTLTPLI